MIDGCEREQRRRRARDFSKIKGTTSIRLTHPTPRKTKKHAEKQNLTNNKTIKVSSRADSVCKTKTQLMEVTSRALELNKSFIFSLLFTTCI